MRKIVVGGVYKARCGLEAVVYWETLSGSGQHFVRDGRGYDWCVNPQGQEDFSHGKKHPLDLIEDTGRRIPNAEDMRFHHKWKRAPETLATFGTPKKKRP
jgi:hypothetical protein